MIPKLRSWFNIIYYVTISSFIKKDIMSKTVITRLHFLSRQYFYNIDSRCPTFIIKINKNT